MLPGQMRLLAPHHRWAELLAVLSDRGTTAIRYTVHQNLCTGCCKPCPTSLLFQANSRESLPFLPMFPVRWKEVHLKRSFPECCGIWKFTQGSLFPAGEIFWCGSVLACRRGCVVRVKLLCAPEEGASGRSQKLAGRTGLLSGACPYGGPPGAPRQGLREPAGL